MERLRAEAEQLRKDVANAERLAALDAQLASFERNLDDQQTAAAAVAERSTAAERTARDQLTAARARLGQRQQEWEEFADVEAGVRCSRCGQTVGPEHVEQERARLAALVVAN